MDFSWINIWLFNPETLKQWGDLNEVVIVTPESLNVILSMPTFESSGVSLNQVGGQTESNRWVFLPDPTGLYYGRPKWVDLGYPLVNNTKKLLKMAIEIVDFPIKNGDFPWFSIAMLVHQRVVTVCVFSQSSQAMEGCRRHVKQAASVQFWVSRSSGSWFQMVSWCCNMLAVAIKWLKLGLVLY